MPLSLSQIAHARLRFPAWLGMLAILMLFVAPLVSKTLVAQGVAMPMMPMMAGIEMSDRASSIDNPATDDISAMAMPDRASDDGRHSLSSASIHTTMPVGDMMDAACGYCVLLMHLPLMVMLALTVLWSRATVVRPAPPRAVACPYFAPIFNDSRPRAPPVPVSLVLPFKA